MPQIKTLKFKASVRLPHPVTIFAITIEGLQPLFLVGGRLRILDRNLISRIRDPRKSAADKYWISQLNSPGSLINPIFSAFEGWRRRTPTKDEFVAEYFVAEAVVREHLPQARLIPHNNESIAASYALVEDLASRREQEASFLLKAAPLVAVRPSHQELRKIEEKVLAAAASCGMTGSPLSLLAVLSCLYESKSGTPASTGRGVLHPKRDYSALIAHNCLSDLLALELVLVSSSLGLGRNAFITGDRRLGKFWQSLGATAGEPVNGKARANFFVTEKLLHRATATDMQRLQGRLSE